MSDRERDHSGAKYGQLTDAESERIKEEMKQAETERSKERAERCETCRFWFQDEEDVQEECKEGLCRRYPPQMVYQKWFVINDWTTLPERPNMDPSDWCGEWQPKQ